MDVDGLDETKLNGEVDEHKDGTDAEDRKVFSVVDVDAPDAFQWHAYLFIAQGAYDYFFSTVIEDAHASNDKPTRNEHSHHSESLHLQLVQCVRVVGLVDFLTHLEKDDDQEQDADLIAFVIVAHKRDCHDQHHFLV